MPETPREKQVREAQEKAVRTGNRKDLEVYWELRRQDYWNEQANSNIAQRGSG